MHLLNNFPDSEMTRDGKAAAVNLALFLDVHCYNVTFLRLLSENLTEHQKSLLYGFWNSTNEVTARAALCLAEFEGII